MPQIFRHSTNYLARTTIFGAAFLLLAALWVGAQILRSGWNTGQHIERQQPIQFSHKHHVGDDCIDCRYCHTSVETSHFAGLPATEICMTCHSQIWNNVAATQAIRDSWASGQSIPWTRVHNLPDFVYFNHSIHINKGIGCSACHGDVSAMPLIYKVNTLNMNWCINCHRNPEKYVRPRDQVFNMAYEAPANQEELGRKLVQENHIQSLTDCYTCHR